MQGQSKEGTEAPLSCQRPYLTIPAQRQVLGVVDDLIVFVLTFALTDLLFLFLLTLFPGPRLLALHIFMRQLPLLLRDNEACEDSSPCLGPPCSGEGVTLTPRISTYS